MGIPPLKNARSPTLSRGRAALTKGAGERKMVGPMARGSRRPSRGGVGAEIFQRRGWVGGSRATSWRAPARRSVRAGAGRTRPGQPQGRLNRPWQAVSRSRSRCPRCLAPWPAAGGRTGQGRTAAGSSPSAEPIGPRRLCPPASGRAGGGAGIATDKNRNRHTVVPCHRYHPLLRIVRAAIARCPENYGTVVGVVNPIRELPMTNCGDHSEASTARPRGRGFAGARSGAGRLGPAIGGPGRAP